MEVILTTYIQWGPILQAPEVLEGIQLWIDQRWNETPSGRLVLKVHGAHEIDPWDEFGRFNLHIYHKHQQVNIPFVPWIRHGGVEGVFRTSPQKK